MWFGQLKEGLSEWLLMSKYIGHSITALTVAAETGRIDAS